LLPLISFSSNLLMLRYFGVDRFAVLATLLQGTLLATVLLKFGADDALLYGRSETLADTRRLQPEVLVGLFGLVALVVLVLSLPLGGGLLTNGFQVLILGFLNAQLAISAMRLQVQGHVWLGNLAQSIAAPIAAIIGAAFLPIWWPNLAKSGDSLMFFFSIGLGFVFWLVLLRILELLPTYRKKYILGQLPSATSTGGVAPITRSLWLLQIIDVMLLSSDLIFLGLFNKLEGLGHYVAASRLAVASAFVLLATEQSLATIQRSGRQFRIPFWLVPVIMLAMIPLYVLILYILGIRAEVHYDLATLIILMTATAGQSTFLRSKVRWAGQEGVDPLHTSILKILAFVFATSCFLCWLGLELELTAAMRAACFGALALLARSVLFLRMEMAVSAVVITKRSCA
jgi:hypothetical protein